jgi:hypothetical protein
MKIKDGYKLRSVCGSAIVVAVGKAVADLNGLVTLNETGEYLWSILENGSEPEALARALSEEYSIDEVQAKTDVVNFISQLKGAGLVEE